MTTPSPLAVTLDERDALLRHLLNAERVWIRPDRDIRAQATTWFDAECLLRDLARGETCEGRLELTLPLENLQPLFTDIREDLREVDTLDPMGAAIVAGICERVLGAGEQAL